MLSEANIRRNLRPQHPYQRRQVVTAFLHIPAGKRPGCGRASLCPCTHHWVRVGWGCGPWSRGRRTLGCFAEGPGKSCLTSEEPFQIFPYILTHWTKLNFAIFSASTSWANTASRERHLLPTCRFRPGAREPTVILREPTRARGKEGTNKNKKEINPKTHFT